MLLFVLLLSTASVVLSNNADSPNPLSEILSDNLIQSINEKKSWIAGRNFPADTKLEDLKKLGGFLGLHPDPNYKPKILERNLERAAIPETFDAREKWPNCASLNRIRNQGACGSCWAFAAVETMSDRLCIHSKGALDFTFSPQELVGCCTSCGNCGGGYMMPAYDYYIQQGVVSGGDWLSNAGCQPYDYWTFSAGQNPSCVRDCTMDYNPSFQNDKHYGKEDYVVSSSIDQIQYDIMTNGPLMVNFELFADFYNYKSGVYRHLQGDHVDYHVVKIIGWGTEEGLPYWLIANSWGADWGDNGFFKILRGANECGIENYPYAVLPQV